MSNLPLTPEMQRQAVSIADSRCRSDIELMGTAIEGQLGQYSLNDMLGRPSRSLAGASFTLQDSVAWLQARELASIRLGEPGVIVVLHLDRFDIDR